MQTIDNFEKPWYLTLAVTAPCSEDNKETNTVKGRAHIVEHLECGFVGYVSCIKRRILWGVQNGAINPPEFHLLAWFLANWGRSTPAYGDDSNNYQPVPGIQNLISQSHWIFLIENSIFPGEGILFKDMPNKKQKQASPNAGLQPLDRRYDVDGVEKIDIKALETIPYEYPGKDVVIDIDTDEFTAVCPYSGLPDFGTIKIHYIPKNDLIELRSLKYYLLSYRSVGIYQEHVVNRILQDLGKCCKPKWMQVIADYKIRGGIHTVASAEWGKRG